MPTTTVIIPTFHGETFLPRALASLLRQTDQDFDVIVASDDGHDYLPQARHLMGDRVQQVTTARPGSGPAAGRMAAMALTRAPVLAFLDVDDEYPDRRLEALVPLAMTHGAAACNIARFDGTTDAFIGCSCPSGTPVNGVLHQKHMAWVNGPIVPVVRRDCLARYPDMKVFEDILFATRVIGNVGNALPVVDDPTVNYRYLVQQSSLSYGAQADDAIKRSYQVLLEQALTRGPLFDGVGDEGREAFEHAVRLKMQRDHAYTDAKAREPNLTFQTFAPRFDATMARLMASIPESLRPWAVGTTDPGRSPSSTTSRSTAIPAERITRTSSRARRYAPRQGS